MGHVKTWLNVAADTKNDDQILMSSTLGHRLSLQSHQTVHFDEYFCWRLTSCLNETGVCMNNRFADVSAVFFSLLGKNCQTEQWFPEHEIRMGFCSFFMARGAYTEMRTIQMHCHSFFLSRAVTPSADASLQSCYWCHAGFLSFQAPLINALISHWMDCQEKHAEKQWPASFIFLVHHHFGPVNNNKLPWITQFRFNSPKTPSWLLVF